jgi:hypothetical protein
LRPGRPRGPGKAFKNMGGLRLLHLGNFVRALGSGQTSKMNPTKSGQTAFRYPVFLYADTCTHGYPNIRAGGGTNEAERRANKTRSEAIRGSGTDPSGPSKATPSCTPKPLGRGHRCDLGGHTAVSWGVTHRNGRRFFGWPLHGSHASARMHLLRRSTKSNCTDTLPQSRNLQNY